MHHYLQMVKTSKNLGKVVNRAGKEDTFSKQTEPAVIPCSYLYPKVPDDNGIFW